MKKRILRDINEDMKQVIDLKIYIKSLKKRVRSTSEQILLDHIMVILEEKIEALFLEAH